MKKILALSLILSMSVAIADDVVYGAFVLNSDKEQVILCVPWVNPGSVDGAIKVTDLLDKSTLAAGDEIFYYDLGKKDYISWQLSATKEWELDQNATPDDGVEPTLVRGNAIILKRDMTNRSDTRIIINGQVGTNPAGAMTMARAEGLAYTLIAPASPDKATPLNSGTWTGVQENDIVLVNLKPYYYKNGEWGVRGKTLVKDETTGKLAYSWEKSDVEIPAGQGAWFVAQGAEAVTTTWNPAN